MIKEFLSFKSLTFSWFWGNLVRRKMGVAFYFMTSLLLFGVVFWVASVISVTDLLVLGEIMIGLGYTVFLILGLWGSLVGEYLLEHCGREDSFSIRWIIFRPWLEKSGFG